MPGTPILGYAGGISCISDVFASRQAVQGLSQTKKRGDHAMKAVQFHEYGGIDVLRVEEVECPVPGPGQALVEVRSAAIQPGEAMIRKGARHDRWPATFPSGQGSDLAGVVVEVGPQVRGVAVGDEVLGFTHNRASHAEFVVVDDVDLTSRPEGLSWDASSRYGGAVR